MKNKLKQESVDLDAQVTEKNKSAFIHQTLVYRGKSQGIKIKQTPQNKQNPNNPENKTLE